MLTCQVGCGNVIILHCSMAVGAFYLYAGYRVLSKTLCASYLAIGVVTI